MSSRNPSKNILGKDSAKVAKKGAAPDAWERLWHEIQNPPKQTSSCLWENAKFPHFARAHLLAALLPNVFWEEHIAPGWEAVSLEMGSETASREPRKGIDEKSGQRWLDDEILGMAVPWYAPVSESTHKSTYRRVRNQQAWHLMAQRGLQVDELQGVRVERQHEDVCNPWVPDSKDELGLSPAVRKVWEYTRTIPESQVQRVVSDFSLESATCMAWAITGLFGFAVMQNWSRQTCPDVLHPVFEWLYKNPAHSDGLSMYLALYALQGHSLAVLPNPSCLITAQSDPRLALGDWARWLASSSKIKMVRQTWNMRPVVPPKDDKVSRDNAFRLEQFLGSPNEVQHFGNSWIMSLEKSENPTKTAPRHRSRFFLNDLMGKETKDPDSWIRWLRNKESWAPDSAISPLRYMTPAVSAPTVITLAERLTPHEREDLAQMLLTQELSLYNSQPPVICGTQVSHKEWMESILSKAPQEKTFWIRDSLRSARRFSPKAMTTKAIARKDKKGRFTEQSMDLVAAWEVLLQRGKELAGNDEEEQRLLGDSWLFYWVVAPKDEALDFFMKKAASENQWKLSSGALTELAQTHKDRAGDLRALRSMIEKAALKESVIVATKTKKDNREALRKSPEIVSEEKVFPETEKAERSIPVHFGRKI